MKSLLHRSMVLFNNVVQVLAGSNQDKLPLEVFAAQESEIAMARHADAGLDDFAPVASAPVNRISYNGLGRLKLRHMGAGLYGLPANAPEPGTCSGCQRQPSLSTAQFSHPKFGPDT